MRSVPAKQATLAALAALLGCELVPYERTTATQVSDGGGVTTTASGATPCSDAERDVDGDGYIAARCGGVDCDDANDDIHPGRDEVACNDVDDDCDAQTSDAVDADGDRHSVCDGDCDDENADIYPGNNEVPCNGVDDDCDPLTIDGGVDEDGDGFGVCAECNDDDDTVNPLAPEACGDGVDDNCDGSDLPCTVCGDGNIEAPEVCDDGNTVGGDGCRADCLGSEQCGDGFADLAAGEQCDAPQDGACLGGCVACTCSGGAWGFDEVATAAGLDAINAFDLTGLGAFQAQSVVLSGGLAAGDVNGDGWVDLYTVGSALGQSVLWINQADGTFADATAVSLISKAGPHDAGSLFADFNGDGADDLFVGGVAGTSAALWLNQLDGTFVEATSASGLDAIISSVVGASAADVDGDGDLDLLIGCWATDQWNAEHLWRNDAGVFTPASTTAGLDDLGISGAIAFSFTPIFDHFNGDDHIDLAVASDFGTSRLYLGDGAGAFNDATSGVVSDENGMGTATGDVDNDGDVDWLVTSIWDPNGVPEANWGVSGNRLYLNDGTGQLVDRTDMAGVRKGYWGWGSCMADFDNDGFIDIFHVNGFSIPPSGEFLEDPALLYLNDRDGTFTERAFELNVVERGQGRGVSCVDYDRDGDIDIIVHNNDGPLRLYRNNGVGVGHYLSIRLQMAPPNVAAIGARIELTAGGMTQQRTIKAGGNYASQDPSWAHFGLGAATTIDAVTVRWPDGTTSTPSLAADQHAVVSAP